MQLRRVGGLGLEYEPSLGLPNDGVSRSPPMRFPPVMEHQQLFARMVDQYVRQQRRELGLAQLRADRLVGAPRQRGHRPIDRHRGLVIPRRDLRHLVHQAPLRGQRRMATHRRCVHQE
jgi:hypothetical protein